MAEKRVGSIKKGKDGKPDYIEITEDLPKGFYQLRSKKDTLTSIDKGQEAGRISDDFAEKLRTYAEKDFPEFVRFNIIKIVDKKK